MIATSKADMARMPCPLSEDWLSNLLSQAAAAVDEPTPEQARLIKMLGELQERLAAQELRIAVLGQFKRGKSSLLNALLGMRALPMGIVPVTAIPTFIRSAPNYAIDARRGGVNEKTIVNSQDELSAVLERFVSETGNPKNRLDIEEVHVCVPLEPFANGLVLIDTPGVGSTLEHNTKAAEAVLAKCDAALFVVSADPPITEVELSYLSRIRPLIPKIIFVLNKCDLLSAAEREVARDFLVQVLSQQAGINAPIEIWPVSAREALAAQDIDDREALNRSGLIALKNAIVDALAQEKRGILLDVVLQRATMLIDQLRFQTELRLKSLMLPLEQLASKVSMFEQSAAQFEEQRLSLVDAMSADRQRLLRELNEQTDRLWKAAQIEFRTKFEKRLVADDDLDALRNEIACELSTYFDAALVGVVGAFRLRIGQRLSAHQLRADSLLKEVSERAAELMDIAIPRSEPREAFRVDKDPYWVAPEQLESLLSLSTASLSRFLPRQIREERARRQRIAELDRAVLRNVSNLDWAMRQNIEEAFRRFEFSLRDELSLAMNATGAAMRIALERHQHHEETVSHSIKETNASVDRLDLVLGELATAAAPNPAQS